MGRSISRSSSGTEAFNWGSSAAFRRVWAIAASVGLLFAVMTSGCASTDHATRMSPVDIVILTTDRNTTQEMLARLQNVESAIARRAGKDAWTVGRLSSVRQGDVYEIRLRQIGGHDEAAMSAIMRSATGTWHPRYVLLVGTAEAVPNQSPLGAVGIVPLICGFDLQRFEKLRDTGNCYRSDGGLFTAALSVADEWETAVEEATGRVGCAPARVMKLGTLSGIRDPDPEYVATATSLSKDIRRGLMLEQEGSFAAKAIEEFRQQTREPIGFLMIRGVSEVLGLETDSNGAASTTMVPERRARDRSCAARDAADFAIELIRRRWPVSPRTKH